MPAIGNRMMDLQGHRQHQTAILLRSLSHCDDGRQEIAVGIEIQIDLGIVQPGDRGEVMYIGRKIPLGLYAALFAPQGNIPAHGLIELPEGFTVRGVQAGKQLGFRIPDSVGRGGGVIPSHLTFAVAVKAQVDNGVHCVGRQPGQTGRQPERPGFGCVVQDSDVHIGSDAVSAAGVVHIVLIVFSTVPGGKINGVKHSWFLRFRRFRVDRLSQIETA